MSLGEKRQLCLDSEAVARGIGALRSSLVTSLFKQ